MTRYITGSDFDADNDPWNKIKSPVLAFDFEGILTIEAKYDARGAIAIRMAPKIRTCDYLQHKYINRGDIVYINP